MEQENQIKSKPKNAFKRLLGYGWILKNLLFFLFLALLAIIYIANGHIADNMIRELNVTVKEVTDLKYQYKSLKSQEMFKSRETEIVQAVAPLGLKMSKEKPVHLKEENVNDKTIK